MNTKLIYTWIGLSDLRACGEVPGNTATPRGHGPVADTLLYLADELDEAVLLYDGPSDVPLDATPGGRYLNWLQARLNEAGKRLTLKLHRTGEGDPTAFDWVYNAMRQAIAAHERDRDIAARHYLVGPGTPTMAACTLLIARLAACIGTLWQGDVKSTHGCRRLELPFALALEDAPDPASHAARRAPGVQSATRPDPQSAIVRSPSTQRAWQLGQRAAASAWPVLILGNKAAEIVGLSERGQVWPIIIKRIREEGEGGIVHKSRERQSNRAKHQGLKDGNTKWDGSILRLQCIWLWE